MTFDELLDRIDAAYPDDPPRTRDLWRNSLATEPPAKVGKAVGWWIREHADRPPAVADIHWVIRTQLDADIARAGLAQARAALRREDQLPLDQEDSDA